MKRNHPESPWKYIGLIGSIGLELFFLIIAGAYVGRKLDERFHTEPLFLAVGIFGGFTTFSSFSLDAIALIERGEIVQSAIYILGSVVIAILALYVGMQLTRGSA